MILIVSCAALAAMAAGDISVDSVEYDAASSRLVVAVSQTGYNGNALFYFFDNGEKIGQVMASLSQHINAVYVNYQLTQGEHDINVQADPLNAITETNKENNAITTRINFNPTDIASSVATANQSGFTFQAVWGIGFAALAAVLALSFYWRRPHSYFRKMPMSGSGERGKGLFSKKNGMKNNESSEEHKGLFSNKLSRNKVSAEDNDFLSAKDDVEPERDNKVRTIDKDTMSRDDSCELSGYDKGIAISKASAMPKANTISKASAIVKGSTIDNAMEQESFIKDSDIMPAPTVGIKIKDVIAMPKGSQVTFHASLEYQDKIGKDYAYFLRDGKDQIIGFSKSQISRKDATIHGVVDTFLGENNIVMIHDAQ